MKSNFTHLLCDVLHQPPETSSDKELRWAVELIIRVERMGGDEIDTLLCAFKKGPLWDGDVPSKQARTQLVDEGFMARVVVKGEDGYNACTYKGAWAARLLLARKSDKGKVGDGSKLWLWRHGDHYLAFTNEYPCFTPGGDPMTLGVPFGYAIFHASHDR